MGIDPSTARRQFKRYCGMTFQAYHRARRMGLALLDIRKGKTVLDSQLDQGFESGSGFREAFARLVGTAPSRAQDVGVLHAQWLETPLGADARAGRRPRSASPRFRRPARARARTGDAAAAPAAPGCCPASTGTSRRSSASSPNISPARALHVQTPRRAHRFGVPDARVERAAAPFPPGTTCSYAELAATNRPAAKRCAPSAAPTATTGCRSSCPAIA